MVIIPGIGFQVFLRAVHANGEKDPRWWHEHQLNWFLQVVWIESPRCELLSYENRPIYPNATLHDGEVYVRIHTWQQGHTLPKHEWTHQDGEVLGWKSLVSSTQSCPWLRPQRDSTSVKGREMRLSWGEGRNKLFCLMSRCKFQNDSKRSRSMKCCILQSSARCFTSR